jgi:hypothetical protein
MKTKTVSTPKIVEKQMLADLRPSVGNISKGEYDAPKTSGIKIRGTGAATKGTTARGPMA